MVLPYMIHVTFERLMKYVNLYIIMLGYQKAKSSVKVFLRALSIVLKCWEPFPDLPSPPQPILTLWGTWIDSVLYYADNFISMNLGLLTVYKTIKQNLLKTCNRSIYLYYVIIF